MVRGMDFSGTRSPSCDIGDKSNTVIAKYSKEIKILYTNADSLHNKLNE